MSKLKLGISAAAMVAAALAQAHAEESIENGRALAEEWCVRCHNIDPDGPFKLQPPSFAAIAVYRSKQQIYARIAIPSIHSGMPQVAYVLTPENILDLVAYIVSLEKK